MAETDMFRLFLGEDHVRGFKSYSHFGEYIHTYFIEPPQGGFSGTIIIDKLFTR